MDPINIFGGPSFPEAKCRGTLDQFFQKSEADLEAVSKSLIKICFSCIHIDECREYAIGNREPFGVWGGTTPTIRRRLIAQDAFHAEAAKREEELYERKL